MRVLWTLLLLSLVSTAAPAQSPPAGGSTGYGLSVYSAAGRQRFGVEILGVLEKAGGTGNTILARLSGAPLELTGVQQGMSGSPVWVDGELVGAVAATWPFAKEPLAVLRPIADMRRLASYLADGEHPTWHPGQDDAPAPELSMLSLEEGNAVRAALLPAELGNTSPPTEVDPLWPLTPDPGLSWSASGFAPEVFRAIETRLGVPLSPAFRATPMPARGEATGSTAAAADSASLQPLQAGDPLAVMLVDGDARIAASGTITEIQGETVLAFGHPFLGAGPVSLPMHRAEILGVFPSQQISFKFANPTGEVGALLLDRAAGVAGRLGVRADVLPVEVEVRSEEGVVEHFEYRVARHPALIGPLVYWCVQNSLSVSNDLSAPASAQMQLVLEIAGEEDLRSEAAVTGLEIGGALAGEVMLPLGLLGANSQRPVRVEKVKVALQVERGIRSAELGRVQMRPTRPEAGETLRVRVELLPFRAEARWWNLEIDLPAQLPAGRYLLHLSNGNQAFATELSRAPARWGYPGLEPIRAAFEQRRSAETLVMVLYGAPDAAVVRGREWKQLPGSVLSVIERSNGAPAGDGVAATALARAERSGEWVLNGEISLPFEIGEEPPEPAEPEGAEK